MDQKQVVIYVKPYSPYCWRARRLLQRRGYAFEQVEVSSKNVLFGLDARPGTVPQVFVDGRPVGGLATIAALDRSGDLDRLVRGDV
jgi:glutaredoxin 3